MLSLDRLSVSILQEKGERLVDTVIHLDSEAERIVVADVNNDKRDDILLFGKGSSGVSTLTGRANGTYAHGIVLFPELSVSDLKVTDLNGDGITDILLLDWLSNHLVLFYGIGRGVFSEQLTVDLVAEPAELCITDVTKIRTIRVAVTLPEVARISVFTGNAIGEFEDDGAMTIDGSPEGIAFAHLNNDLHPDLITSSDKGMLVFLATSMTRFGLPTVFGVWDATSSWSVFDVDGDKKKDLVLTDKPNKRLVLVSNADYSGVVNWPHQYSVGKNPRGLTASDFNGDGLTDIAVVNSTSSSLSVLFNKGKGRMDGQQSALLPANPMYVKTVSSPLTGKRTLVTTHSNADGIAVVELHEDVRNSSTLTIPTSSSPYVLFAKKDSPNKPLEVLVRNTNPEDGSLSLSMFEQIDVGQFVERSLRSNLPDKTTALTVDDLTRNGMYDLIFVTHDTVSKNSTLSLGFGDQNFNFHTVNTLLTYKDSTVSTRDIISGYVDGDAFKDIVLLLASPRNALGIVLGRGNGTFRDSLEWVEGIQPLDDDALILHDLNSDGDVDITLLDRGKESVVVLYGRGRGVFEKPVSICSSKGVTSIRVASLKKARVQDLILSNTFKGTISLMFDPFTK
jgi:hypothetical protein